MSIQLSPLRLLFISGLFLGFVFFIPDMAHSKTKTIRYHSGGGVTNVYIDVIRADKNGTRVRIAGRCISACTLYLASKEVCVTRTASFKFHQAQKSKGLRYKAEPNPEGTRFLMSKYPPLLRNWIESQGGLPWKGWLTLKAKTAVKLGIATYC